MSAQPKALWHLQAVAPEAISEGSTAGDSHHGLCFIFQFWFLSQLTWALPLPPNLQVFPLSVNAESRLRLIVLLPRTAQPSRHPGQWSTVH